MSYSVILPTLNESGHIIRLVNKISYIFHKRKKKFEIIIVDDSSTDGTANKIREHIQKTKNLKLIVRKKKRNLAESINDGIRKSRYDYVIWLDADFQHPPKYINMFINKKKNDVIVCSRFLKNSKRYFNEKNKKVKSINENQSVFFNKLCNFFLFKDFKDYTSGYICIKKAIVKNIQLKGYYGDYFLELICDLKLKNLKIIEIPFKDSTRASGQSKTIVKFNLKYIYVCFRYFLTLIKNIFKIYL